MEFLVCTFVAWCADCFWSDGLDSVNSLTAPAPAGATVVASRAWVSASALACGIAGGLLPAWAKVDDARE